MNEQEEQLKDQKYLDGFNIGYQLQKKTEDKSLSKEDSRLIQSMIKALKKSKSDNDKIQGMLDGRLQRVKDKELRKDKDRSKTKSRGHER